MKKNDMGGALDDAWEKPRLEWAKGDPDPAFPSAPTAQLSEMFILQFYSVKASHWKSH